MISISSFLPTKHSIASNKIMTPEWIKEGILKFTGTSGFYFVKFNGEFADVRMAEPQDMSRLNEIDHDLLITDGAVFLLFVDKAFVGRVFKEIWSALKNVKGLQNDGNWNLEKRGGQYILEAFTHGDDIEVPVFSTVLPAPTVEFPKMGLCTSRDPEYSGNILCLANED